jgi:hypothetical protein
VVGVDSQRRTEECLLGIRQLSLVTQVHLRCEKT